MFIFGILNTTGTNPHHYVIGLQPVTTVSDAILTPSGLLKSASAGTDIETYLVIISSFSLLLFWILLHIKSQ